MVLTLASLPAPENRGVPGSSPGLAIRGDRRFGVVASVWAAQRETLGMDEEQKPGLAPS